MGEIYRAHDSRLGRQVAIKLLPAALSGDPDRLARFEQEARAAAALNHPNILTVHDVGRHDGAPYIVSELLQGQTLRERLEAGPLPPRQAADYAAQIARGLSAAHEHSITHRDLKPANIFVTNDGRLKILDFGLAKLTHDEAGAIPRSGADSPAETIPGLLLGTIGYMAPEQVRGLAADHRSDIFALGAILYEMLSGQPAFRGETSADTLSAVLEKDPPDLAGSRHRVPVALARIVDRCLEKDPAARFESARDLAFALDVHADLQRLKSVSDATGSTLPVYARWRTKATTIAASVAIIGVLVTGTWFWWRTARQRSALELIPEIARLADTGEFAKAARLARIARVELPGQSVIERLWERSTVAYTLQTDPPGANVDIRPWASDPDAWERIGETPLQGVRVTRATNVWRISAAGYSPIEFVLGSESVAQPGSHVINYTGNIPKVRLRLAETVPSDMVAVRGADDVAVNSLPLGPLRIAPVADFLIDRHEVTNEAFKKFVDAGGYRKPEFWKQTLILDGREIAWDQAIDRFRDSTGRPGPSTWEAGTYPNGQARHPVGGISWYEAAAFAEFVGRSLPTALHWTLASQNSLAIIASSGNFRVPRLWKSDDLKP